MTTHGRTALTIWISRGICIACKVITLPLLLKILKIEEYAALAILVALESWFLLLDFGLGASIQNFLSETFSEEKRKALLKTTFVLGAIACTVGALFLLLFYPFLAEFFLGNCVHLESAHNSFLLAGAFLLMGTFGSLGGRVLMGEQRGGVFYIIQAVAGLISLCMLLGFQSQIHFREAIFLSLGIPSLSTFLLACFLMRKVDFKAPLDLDVMKRAKQFGLFALMAACVLSSDALLVPKVLDSYEITQYNILLKLFSPIAFTYSAWLQAFGPTCTGLWAKGQGVLVAKKISRYCAIGVAAGVMFTLFLVLTSGSIERFLGLSLPLAGILWGGLYLSSRIVSDFHAMALQSRSELKPFFYLVPIQAVISIILQWILSYFFGPTGILAGLTLSYLATMCWMLPRRLQQLKSGISA